MKQVLVLAITSGALVALFLAVARLLRGPTQADRIVALDVVFSSSIALSAAAAVASATPVYLDVGIGLAIVGFVATILWARLIDESPRSAQEAPRPGKSARKGGPA